MGNYASCTLSNSQGLKSPRSTKVVLPNGQVKDVKNHPMKAAEIMLEAPSYFIVNSKTLKMGRRFCSLGADVDLEKSSVYVLFPMERKNTLVNASDLGRLFIKANSVVRRASFGRRGRVQPEGEGEERRAEEAAKVLPRLSFEGVEEMSSQVFIHKLSMTRSRKPALETIHEDQATGRLKYAVNGRRGI